MTTSSGGDGHPVKAGIFDEDDSGPAPVVTFMFNPEQYTVKKTNNWTSESQRERDIPLVVFGSGGDTTLTLNDLHFDTYGATPATDVRAHTGKVFDLMKIVPRLGRPKKVSFRWKGGYFRAVITSATQALTMFLSDGTPVRAKVSLEFRMVEEGSDAARGTNPTSFARSYKVRTVLQGETLDTIAFQEYGDPMKWRAIADYNSLEDPLRLRPGQRLALPPGL